MFTKGEWKVGHPFENVTAIIVAVTPSRTDLIANIKWGSNISVDEQKANGQLMSAAQDMYEALKELMERVNGGIRFPLMSTVNKANEALAKAEGEEEHGTLVLGFKEGK